MQTQDDRATEIIGPHLEYQGGTAADIGAYLATFSHWLCDLGYRVTAVERQSEYVAIAREVRDLCGKEFEIFEGRFSDLPAPTFDVVLALNVFHHCLKRPGPFRLFESFLDRLDCRMMIFESHHPNEGFMAGAYRPMGPQQFAEFIGAKTGLTRIEEIGTAGVRTIFKLKR
jgi:hypothetical protein